MSLTSWEQPFLQTYPGTPIFLIFAKKLAKTIGTLRRLQNSLPCSVLLAIYNSLFAPYLHQSILVWGHAAGRIFKLQKRVIRLVFKLKK